MPRCRFLCLIFKYVYLQTGGLFTRIVSMPLSITATFNAYHGFNGDGPFDGQIGFETHSACQCKFDGGRDGDRNGNITCT